MTQINANTKNTAAAVEFENGQSVTVTGGRHAGKQAWFNKLSGGGNGEAYCFIWFKGTANMSGARVKVSDIAPEAVEQPAAFVQATNERDNAIAVDIFLTENRIIKNIAEDENNQGAGKPANCYDTMTLRSAHATTPIATLIIKALIKESLIAEVSDMIALTEKGFKEYLLIKNDLI